MEVYMFTTLLVLLLGLAVGSFLNVVIYRIPREMSLVRPGSHCPRCKSRIRPFDLVPVFGWIALCGRCRACGERISSVYPLVELMTGGLFVLAYMAFGPTAAFVRTCVFLSTLLALSFIDLEHRILPNSIVLLGFLMGIPLSLIISPGVLLNGLLGALVCGGGLLLIALVYPAGMGGGDVKLAGMIGLYLGLGPGLLALFMGFWAGALFGLTMIVLRRMTRKDYMPFGPFLSLGALIMTLWGDSVVQWWLLNIWRM
ncbi:MAG: prepilin peptidase [Bacillota bacterium]